MPAREVLGDIFRGLSTGLGTFTDLESRARRQALENALLEQRLDAGADAEDRQRQEAQLTEQRERLAGRREARQAKLTAREERRTAERGEREALEQARAVMTQFPDQFERFDPEQLTRGQAALILRQAGPLSTQSAQAAFPEPKVPTPRAEVPEEQRIEKIAADLVARQFLTPEEARRQATAIVRGGGQETGVQGPMGVLPEAQQRQAVQFAQALNTGQATEEHLRELLRSGEISGEFFAAVLQLIGKGGK
jgi:hypothetical protein